MKTTFTAVMAAVVTSALLYLFVPTRPAQPSPTVYSKVRANQTIRAAYLVGAPLFMIDPNTKEKSGTFYDEGTKGRAFRTPRMAHPGFPKS